MSESIESQQTAFNTADITALSHLYRGELYRSTVWRTRLDTTTNWAVLTTGIALSLTFSSETASPLPLVLVGQCNTDRKSTRLNSSHLGISYAVFCLKKKK